MLSVWQPFRTSPFNNPIFNKASKSNALATRLSTGGISFGTGDINSAEKAITRLERSLVAQTYKNADWQAWNDKKAIGFIVSRGSSYPCSTCDFNIGFHKLEFATLPPYHANCRCWAYPIYENKINVGENEIATRKLTEIVESIDKNNFRSGIMIEAGILPKEVIRYCKKNNIKMGEDGFILLSEKIGHLRRDAKIGRGAAISREDVINIIPNIHNADIYFDQSHNNLLFVCKENSGNGLIKYAITPNYKSKGKEFSTVVTAGKIFEGELKKYIKIK